MELMSPGDLRNRPTRWASLVVVLAIGLLAGCAPVTSRPVATSPADVVPQPTSASSPDDLPSPDAATAPGESTFETAVAVPFDDVQPAEEVEPSPLDELPATTPEVSAADFENDKNLVAEVAPEFDIPMVLNDRVVAYVSYFSHRHKEFFAKSLVRSRPSAKKARHAER